MTKPVRIFSDVPELRCELCGKNLLEEGNQGNYIVFTDNGDTKFECIKYACKEHDREVTNNARKENFRDAGWDDINDLKIPTMWIKRLMAFINEMHNSPEKISDEYCQDVKELFLNTFPYIVREMEEEEKDRVSELLQFEF